MGKIILLFVTGVSAGVLGGMGMGGGAILIPMLTVFFAVDQINAQAINLVAFIPMAIVSLIIHVKNGRVEKKGLLWIIIPAGCCSLCGSLLALAVKGSFLKRCFGAFLILLSVFQFFSNKILELLQKKKSNTKKGESGEKIAKKF
ncbi:MAG: sulfite exporter TauE/SafE family protein [Clostridiales bacterium]|nr:sulfite exporter TauE/SafE family protein [Clostridiales bacterium]